MKEISKSLNPDTLRILASSLCLVHCLVTPFIFLAKICSTSCCADAPVWWQAIDFFFVVISFVAIMFATKNSSKRWIVIALWSAWVLLLLTMIIEKSGINLLPPLFIYIPSLSIVALHLYNQKYCKCKKEKCCISKIQTVS